MLCRWRAIQVRTITAMFAVAMAAGWLLASAGGAVARDKDPGFRSKAKQAMLVDAASGAVLFEQNADERVPPASMSKLMTLAVVFRAIKRGEIKPDAEIVMSVNAWRTGGAPSGTSAMMVPVGTRESLADLIQGIAVQSGNDAAIAIAEAMAGSEAGFAVMMEAEARRIGLQSSNFRNATGLFHPDHLMTARDIAILSRYIIREYPEQYKLLGAPEFRYRKHRFINRNPLLFLNIGADGLKTGHLSVSGYGLAASAVQGERRLIAVVHGLQTASERKDEARRLLEWGFQGFGDFKLFEAGEVVGSARVWGGEQFYVPLVGANGVKVVLPRFATNQRLRAEIIYNSPLKPPIKKGEQIARLRVVSSTGAVNEVPLFAGEDVAAGGLVRRGLDSLAHMALELLPESLNARTR